MVSGPISQTVSGESSSPPQIRRSRPHDEAMAELYRDDPALALEVIGGVLADGGQAERLIVLRQVTLAFGAVAEPTQVAC